MGNHTTVTWNLALWHPAVVIGNGTVDQTSYRLTATEVGRVLVDAIACDLELATSMTPCRSRGCGEHDPAWRWPPSPVLAARAPVRARFRAGAPQAASARSR